MAPGHKKRCAIHRQVPKVDDRGHGCGGRADVRNDVGMNGAGSAVKADHFSLDRQPAMTYYLPVNIVSTGVAVELAGFKLFATNAPWR
jgi:hypothetical protein